MSAALAPATARGDLLRALGTLVEPPVPGHADLAAALGLPGASSAAEHAELFLFATYPYASVYLGAEGMLGGEARDRIAGFWRALGLTPPPEPDHLATLLGMYASLIDVDADVRGAFLWEHLLSWLPAWLDRVAAIGTASQAAWAHLLRETLLEDARELPAPEALPLALREAPGLPPDDAPWREWVDALLAPVRSGVIVTRIDLRRAARELGMGSRAGERAFMLRSLLEQDAAGVAAWLSAEAARAAADHAVDEATLGAVARFWRHRALATEAALLRVRPDQHEETHDGDH